MLYSLGKTSGVNPARTALPHAAHPYPHAGGRGDRQRAAGAEWRLFEAQAVRGEDRRNQRTVGVFETYQLSEEEFTLRARPAGFKLVAEAIRCSAVAIWNTDTKHL